MGDAARRAARAGRALAGAARRAAPALGDAPGANDGGGFRASAGAPGERGDDARPAAADVRVARAPSRGARHDASDAPGLVARRSAKSPASGSFQRSPDSAFHRQIPQTIASTIQITVATPTISDTAVADTNIAANARR